MASEIRANILKNRVGLGTVSFTNTGPVVSGIITARDGIDVNGDIDVDGHTNLDNVSIAGVTTMSGNLTISNTAPVLKLVDTDNNSDFSIYGAAGVFNIYDETNSASRLTIASDGTITAIQGLVCSSTLTIPDSIIHSGDTNTKIRFPSTDTITTETAGIERLRITSGGHVNIGTGELTQTARKLNVYGGATRVTQTSGGNTVEVFGHTTSGQSYGLLVNAGSTSGDYCAHFRSSSGTALFRIRGDGKVNIGDTQMSQNILNIEDGTAAALDIASHGSGGDTAYIGVKKSSGGGLTIGISNRDIIFKTGATYSNGTVFDSGTERLRINSSGNVGIGTDNAGAPLHIESHSAGLSIRRNGQYLELDGNFGNGSAQAISASNSLRIQTGGIGNSYEKLRITSAGNLALGNTHAVKKVHISTTGNQKVLIDPNYNNNSGGSSNSEANANNIVESILIRTSFGDNAASQTNAGHKWGIKFQGYNGNDFTQATAKCAGVFAVSEDEAGGYNRNVGLTFHTSPYNTAHREVMRINTNGIVTKPYNPAFIAGRTGGNQTFTVGTFPLNVARLNVGNHYSTSTYKFTAPVAGVYYFYGQVYYNNGSGHYRVGFRKEPSGGSAIMLNTAAHHMVGNDNIQNLSIMESLAVGDTVWLFSDQNASIQCYYNINDNTYGAHTYFMGYLIG